MAGGTSMFSMTTMKLASMTKWTARFAVWEKCGIKICKPAWKSLSVNYMNVDISIDELRAERVWYDATTKKLFVQAKDFVNGLDFNSIAEEDFESKTPVVSFSLGHHGAVIICHHKDGNETWLPADMWLPAGFSAK